MTALKKCYLIGVLFLTGCASDSIPTTSDALSVGISRSAFNQLHLNYSSDAMAKWSERLQKLRQGMTRSEVLTLLAPEGSRGSRFMPLGVVTGSGLHETWILDDAYYARLTFSIPKQSPNDSDFLIFADKSPKTITYRVQ